MKSKSVAVLDIRSSQVCAILGERGVNNTFIIKSKYVRTFDGYAEGEHISEQSFVSAVQEVVEETLVGAGSKITAFSVSVPDEFAKVFVAEKSMNFHKPKKITHQMVEKLISSAKGSSDEGYKIIKHSSLYYVLSDKRKIIEPIGETSEVLTGKFCFYQCKKAFVDLLVNTFSRFSKIEELDLIPSSLSQTQYLLDASERDGYAQIFDLGYISSTYSIALGNGVVCAEPFSLGVGHIALHLSETLNIPFNVAEAFLSKINLNAKEKLTSEIEVRLDGKLYCYSAANLRELIREGLDGICEAIEECRQTFGEKNMDGKVLYITGEGVKTIRGAIEHISSRLVANVEVVSPKIPFYDKPNFSSVFSLLAMALAD